MGCSSTSSRRTAAGAPTRDRDGASGLIAITDGDTYNYSIELLEAKFPLLVRRYDYNVGRRRRRAPSRRLRLIREYEILDDAVLYGSFGRTATPPWGVDGGGEGTLNGIEVTRTATGDPPRPRRTVPLGAATSSASSPAAAAAGATRASASPRTSPRCPRRLRHRRRRPRRSMACASTPDGKVDARRDGALAGGAGDRGSPPTSAARSPTSSPSTRGPARSSSARR